MEGVERIELIEDILQGDPVIFEPTASVSDHILIDLSQHYDSEPSDDEADDEDTPMDGIMASPSTTSSMLPRRSSRLNANHIRVMMVTNFDPRQHPDPKSISEAYSRPDAEEWKRACQAELDALELRRVYTPVPRPSRARRNVVGSKWVFKLKKNPDGSYRYKARLVAKRIHSEVWN
jgi:hypothetical protein